MQPGSNLFVGESSADQFYELLFATAEFGGAAGPQIFTNREKLRGATKECDGKAPVKLKDSPILLKVANA